MTMQPIVRDKSGVVRFEANPLVSYLLDWATARGCGMNELALVERYNVRVTNAHRQQFAQLIGYCVSGYGELPYVDDAAYSKAQQVADGAPEGSKP